MAAGKGLTSIYLLYTNEEASKFWGRMLDDGRNGTGNKFNKSVTHKVAVTHTHIVTSMGGSPFGTRRAHLVPTNQSITKQCVTLFSMISSSRRVATIKYNQPGTAPETGISYEYQLLICEVFDIDILRSIV